VLCLPADAAGELVAKLEGAAIVGSIVPGDKVTLENGRVLSLEAGFQHFSPDGI
jgi:hypothetical protein